MSATKPRGRRPGPSVTRDAVLASARELFAERGYGATTIRQIAQRADVDPALVIQYFGSKQGLFEAAIELPFDASQIVARIVDGPKSKIGERLVEAFLSIWDSPMLGPQMVALLRSAASDEAAAQRLREVVDAKMLRPVVESVGMPEPRLRAHLVGSQMIGLGLARYVLGMDPLSVAAPEAVTAWIGPVIQRYLTTELKPRDRAR